VFSAEKVFRRRREFSGSVVSIFCHQTIVSKLLRLRWQLRTKGGRIMKTLVLYGVFAASCAYVSPLADGKWQSRALGVVLVCMVAAAGVLAVTVEQ
jgi:hypothetical protein